MRRILGKQLFAMYVNQTKQISIESFNIIANVTYLNNEIFVQGKGTKIHTVLLTSAYFEENPKLASLNSESVLWAILKYSKCVQLMCNNYRKLLKRNGMPNYV